MNVTNSTNTTASPMTTTLPHTTVEPSVDSDSDLNVAGLISIILFYLMILGIGVYAAWRQKKGEILFSTVKVFQR